MIKEGFSNSEILYRVHTHTPKVDQISGCYLGKPGGYSAAVIEIQHGGGHTLLYPDKIIESVSTPRSKKTQHVAIWPTLCKRENSKIYRERAGKRFAKKLIGQWRKDNPRVAGFGALRNFI